MKKSIIALFLAFFVGVFAACGTPNSGNTGTGSSSNSDGDSQAPLAHVHRIVEMKAQPSTCSKNGNITFYFCLDCKGYYLDEDASVESSYEGTRAPTLPHTPEKVTGYAPTCGEDGQEDYWQCVECERKFLDEACTQAALQTNLVIPATAHLNLVYHEGYAINGEKNGQKEHWYCDACDGYFLDENATEKVDLEDVILYSLFNIPDFVVEVPQGKDPVVLQLTDTQIIDGAQSRPEHSSGDKITYATEKIKQYCYDYLTETITQTQPDLIILTGDIVYGAYDDNGSTLKAFIRFMESFQIPWAPVFGNHDQESKMGADWQCQQLESAEYCLFEQKNLTGNGNYSVAIKQGEEIKRVFYMLDTNGCSNASEESMANGQTSKMVGFGQDQIDWYTQQITQLKALSPQTKISFAYHIQQAVFGEALQKYGFEQGQKTHDIYIDYEDNCADGDFGYIGRAMKDPWDSNKKIFNAMKELGVDSIFVGHEHCNSASVVYEGVRLQYGQKSSEYDRYNSVTAGGEIIPIAIWNKVGTPLVGGSVVVLSQTDGAIKDGYIYYCENAGGNIDWDSIRA